MNTKTREWSLCVGWQTGRATQSDHSRKAAGVRDVRDARDVWDVWRVPAKVRGSGDEG